MVACLHGCNGNAKTHLYVCVVELHVTVSNTNITCVV
jgi:hypothetical protein